MDVKMYTPFIEAFFQVLPSLGFKDVKRGGLELKDKLIATMNVIALVGLSNEVRGNVAYSMTEVTAQKIASIMMMGMPVEQFDDMAQSAVAEMANMLAASATFGLEYSGFAVSISPPTLITGRNINAMVSQVKTLAVEMTTEAGSIEVNIGLEI